MADVNVFSRPKSLVGWSGLAPSLNESAGKSSNGHITKKGKKIAIVALARKLLSIIHHLLKNNEKYSEDELKPKQIKLPKCFINV